MFFLAVALPTSINAYSYLWTHVLFSLESNYLWIKRPAIFIVRFSTDAYFWKIVEYIVYCRGWHLLSIHNDGRSVYKFTGTHTYITWAKCFGFFIVIINVRPVPWAWESFCLYYSRTCSQHRLWFCFIFFMHKRRCSIRSVSHYCWTCKMVNMCFPAVNIAMWKSVREAHWNRRQEKVCGKITIVSLLLMTWELLYDHLLPFVWRSWRCRLTPRLWCFHDQHFPLLLFLLTPSCSLPVSPSYQIAWAYLCLLVWWQCSLWTS